VTPAQTAGPYFVDQQLNRSDIRADPADGSVREGLTLLLTMRVLRASATGCAPLPGAMVDVWHCDAQGVYSGVQDRYANTASQSFLRGYQITDDGGLAQFTTIYPGWYPGRTVHIHFKVRAVDNAGRNVEFTSQLYFDDAISDQVFAQAPYNRRSGRGTRNENDALFRNNGELLMLALSPADSGYAGMFDIGLNIG
jgi:protocatechuate 3,4-dioxygenase beta subunit